MSFKTLGYRLLAQMGGPAKEGREAIAFMMTHGVHSAAMAAAVPPPRNSFPAEAFEANIRALARHWSVISLDDAVAMLTGKAAWRSNCVVLTFDDSLKCMADVSAPLLASLGLTATFFVSTGVIDSRKPYWWRRLEYAVSHATQPEAQIALPSGEVLTLNAASADETLPRVKAGLKSVAPGVLDSLVESVERQLGAALRCGSGTDPYAEILSWEDVRRLDKLGMSVGSHTVTHPNLALLESEELRSELAESRWKIEAECGTPCRHLCYPYGSCNAAVLEAARACGYVSAVTTEAPGWNARGTDLHALRRFAMPAEAFKLPYVLAGFGRD